VAEVRAVAFGFQLILQPGFFFGRQPCGLCRAVGQQAQNDDAEEDGRESFRSGRATAIRPAQFLPPRPSSHPATEPMTTNSGAWR